MIKEKPVIIVDTREKIPWDWEGDNKFEDVIYEKLDVGDYSLRGLEDLVCIERKAHGDELYTNLTGKPKKNYIERFYREIERMKDHKLKFIIIEQSCEDVLNPQSYYINKKKINRGSPMMPVAVVMSNLTNLMVVHGIQVIFGGYKSQSVAKGILLKAFELHQKGEL